MKISLACLTIILIALTTIISCQKEIDGSGETPIVQPGVDSNYLSKFIELDTTYPAGQDTVYKHLYFYDSKKRISEIRESGYDISTHTINYTLTEYRFYNGNDTMPFKIIRNEWDVDTYLDTVYLYYTNSNRIIRDSTIHYMNGSKIELKVNNFNLLSGEKYHVRTFTTDPSFTIFFIDSTRSDRTKTAGNLLAPADSIFRIGFGLYADSKYSFTFDNKKNPFARTLLPYPVFFYDLYHNTISAFAYPIIPTVNNPVTHTQDHVTGGVPVHYTGSVQYSYNGRGYPEIIRYSSSVLSNTQKAFFYYITL